VGRVAGFAAVVGVGLMVFLASALALPSPRSFSFTGREQLYVVPRGVTLVLVNALGAVGGPTATIGQSGLALTAYLPVKPGEVLFTEVGQPGSDQGGPGFGGGGAAGRDIHENIVDAGSGGGATDVRICSEHAAKCAGGGSSTGSRLIVAGGGGGSGGAGAGSGNLCANSSGGGSAGASTGGGSQGGQAVVTAAGTVILASHGQSAAPSTPAGGGSRTAAGSGGSEANCAAGTSTTLTGSAPGSPGNGPAGGAGAAAAGTTGGGGGGGGGYFGGGGGASGWQGCNPNGCSVSSTGGGGGGGSSFVTARAVLAAGGFGPSSAPPSVTYTPQVEIDIPAARATYRAGRVVAARWSCVNTITCKGTVTSGRPIATTPGKHKFTVNAVVSGRTVRSTITYTVKR
jgi:hypothetical protein